jgi:hypothetical protein
MSPVDDVVAGLDDAITNFTQSLSHWGRRMPSDVPFARPLGVSMNCGHTVKTLMIQICERPTGTVQAIERWQNYRRSGLGFAAR